MKKYRKIILKDVLGHERYVAVEDTSRRGNYFLSGLSWALKEFCYEDELICFLDDPLREDQGGNEGLIEKVGNLVGVFTPHDDLGVEEGGEPIPSAVIDIENLKKLARDWKELYERDALAIYLIVRDDDWVVVREKLEDI